MDDVEARLKMAELACSMVETRLRAMPEKYKTNSEVENSFRLFYEAIYKDFARTAQKKVVEKKTPPPLGSRG